jgi:hypothetical protein
MALNFWRSVYICTDSDYPFGNFELFLVCLYKMKGRNILERNWNILIIKNLKDQYLSILCIYSGLILIRKYDYIECSYWDVALNTQIEVALNCKQVVF